MSYDSPTEPASPPSGTLRPNLTLEASAGIIPIIFGCIQSISLRPGKQPCFDDTKRSVRIARSFVFPIWFVVVMQKSGNNVK